MHSKYLAKCVSLISVTQSQMMSSMNFYYIILDEMLSLQVSPYVWKPHIFMVVSHTQRNW